MLSQYDSSHFNHNKTRIKNFKNILITLNINYQTCHHLKTSWQTALHYAITITRVFHQKDTLMIQNHIDMSQLNSCNCGDALIQTGNSNIWVCIRSSHTVLKVQLILITRHRQLCTNTTTQITLRVGISAPHRALNQKRKWLSCSAQLVTVSGINNSSKF